MFSHDQYIQIFTNRIKFLPEIVFIQVLISRDECFRSILPIKTFNEHRIDSSILQVKFNLGLPNYKVNKTFLKIVDEKINYHNSCKIRSWRVVLPHRFSHKEQLKLNDDVFRTCSRGPGGFEA